MLRKVLDQGLGVFESEDGLSTGLYAFGNFGFQYTNYTTKYPQLILSIEDHKIISFSSDDDDDPPYIAVLLENSNIILVNTHENQNVLLDTEKYNFIEISTYRKHYYNKRSDNDEIFIFAIDTMGDLWKLSYIHENLCVNKMIAFNNVDNIDLLYGYLFILSCNNVHVYDYDNETVKLTVANVKQISISNNFNCEEDFDDFDFVLHILYQNNIVNCVYYIKGGKKRVDTFKRKYDKLIGGDPNTPLYLISNGEIYDISENLIRKPLDTPIGHIIDGFCSDYDCYVYDENRFLYEINNSKIKQLTWKSGAPIVLFDNKRPKIKAINSYIQKQ